MIDSDKKSNIFFLVFFLLLLISISMAYYKYIVRHDFQYFTIEEDIPNQFDLSTYTNQL